MRLYALTGQQAAALRQYEECARTLQEELGVSPEDETTRLYQAIRTRRFPQGEGKTRRGGEGEIQAGFTLSPPHPITPTPLHNLPLQPTPFVGRVQEVENSIRQLTDQACRLLTLIGPGGIGKTRLALEIGRRGVDGFDDEPNCFQHGIIFVPLQPVQSVATMASAIANALDLQLHENRSSREQLFDYLAEKEMLLILDNFEHLLEGADLIDEMLQAAPSVKLLVTSRNALQLQEAWFHPVAGMYFPNDEDKDNVTNGGYDAIQLFEQCARRVQGRFSLEDNYRHVVHICQLVEGMPLAIELAAAWLKVLSAADVINEIKKGMDILTSHHQNVPERHRSVRAVFMQSWERLSSDEQSVLTKLAVFQGGCDRNAARQVADATISILASLIDKALLQKTAQDRYQLHELLRQFAAEKLSVGSQWAQQVYERFSRYYLALLAERGLALNGAEQQSVLEEMDSELDNIGASWQWACRQGHFNAVARALAPLYEFHQIRSRYLEGQALLTEAMHTLQTSIEANDQAHDLESIHHMVQARWAALGTSLGHYEEAKAVLQQCLDAARKRDEPKEIAFCYEFLGEVDRCMGDTLGAIDCFEETLALGKAAEDQQLISAALFNLGNALIFEGRYQESKERLTESLTIYRLLGRPDRIAHALDKLGYVTYGLGEYDDSERLYEESLRIFRKIGDKFGIAAAAGGCALLLIYVMDRRQPNKALPLVQEAIALCRESGRREHLALMLITIGDVHMLQEAYALAESAYREGLALSLGIDYSAGVAECYVHLGEMYLHQEEWLSAQSNLHNGLQAAMDARFFKYAIYALVGFAHMIIESPHYQQEEDQARAMAYLTFGTEQLTVNTQNRRGVGAAMATLEARLPESSAKAAQDRGRALPLDVIAADALERFHPVIISP